MREDQAGQASRPWWRWWRSGARARDGELDVPISLVQAIAEVDLLLAFSARRGVDIGKETYDALTTAKKQTKREKFLSEMEAVVQWQALIDLIEPCYPMASKKGGRPPYPLGTMLADPSTAAVVLAQ